MGYQEYLLSRAESMRARKFSYLGILILLPIIIYLSIYL